MNRQEVQKAAMVLIGLLVIMMVPRQGVHYMVISLVHVWVEQRYSSDGFLCLGDFFHHGRRDCTSGFAACWFHVELSC